MNNEQNFPPRSPETPDSDEQEGSNQELSQEELLHMQAEFCEQRIAENEARQSEAVTRWKLGEFDRKSLDDTLEAAQFVIEDYKKALAKIRAKQAKLADSKKFGNKPGTSNRAVSFKKFLRRSFGHDNDNK